MKRKLMMVYLAILSAIMWLFIPQNADAVEDLKGEWSLGIYAALNNSEIETMESDTYEFSFTVLNASIGYFLTDHIEINFSPTIAHADAEGTEANLNNYFGNIKYNFYGNHWQALPYVGLQGGLTKAHIEYQSAEVDPITALSVETTESYDDTSLSFGFMGGIKVFLSENLSLDVEYNWLYSPDLVADLTMTTVYVGLKWYFGGD